LQSKAVSSLKSPVAAFMKEVEKYNNLFSESLPVLSRCYETDEYVAQAVIKLSF